MKKLTAKKKIRQIRMFKKNLKKVEKRKNKQKKEKKKQLRNNVYYQGHVSKGSFFCVSLRNNTGRSVPRCPELVI